MDKDEKKTPTATPEAVKTTPSTEPEKIVGQTLVTTGPGVLAKVVPTIKVGIYKLNAKALDPKYATDGSMCFDIHACIEGDSVVTGYSNLNIKKTYTVGLYSDSSETVSRCGVAIEPGDRVMIPTGLIFDLPENTALMIYPRSGLSLKQSLKLGNCVAVIDNDYVEQTFIIIENTSKVRELIKNGDRICQGEVVIQPPKASFTTLTKRPQQKTSRAGGLGSTGK